MRLFILLTGLFFTVCPLRGQEDSIAQVREMDNIYTATVKTASMVVDLGSAEEVALALQKIHHYKYLECLTFEGEGNDGDLKKLLYRLSVLKNITSITFKENELLKIPDNIVNLKNLQSITIEGNRSLDFQDLFLHLKNTRVTQLNLINNDLKKIPASLAELNSLRKLRITGSNQMDYVDLVDHLAKINGLTTLSIPLNYINELPNNINKLVALQVLDVSNNNLSELPGEVSGLKTINNLSIQGNLLLNPVKDLEKFVGSNIQYISLDKEISGEELEQIRKMLPSVQIDFPVNKDLEETEVKSEQALAPAHTGQLSAKKETVVLSGAYLAYPTFFQGLSYNFDTLLFEERYASKEYETVRRIVRGGVRRTPSLYMRDYCVHLEKPGHRDETWFRFATNIARISSNYPELIAFSGMYWVYKGELDKKEFRKKFLVRRARPDYVNMFGGQPRMRKMPIYWNDVRIDFERNNNLFIITLKSDTGFVSFHAYPVSPYDPIERSQQTYYRRYQLYKRALLRKSQRFNSELARSKKVNDFLYKRLQDYAWKELQLRMSNEEKAMSKEEWLKYYDELVSNEQKALDKTSLAEGYIARSLVLRGYSFPITQTMQVVSAANVSANIYGIKTFNVNFIDSKEGGRLAISNILIIDNKEKTIQTMSGTLGLTPNFIPVSQFASQRMLVELRNGNWGYVSPEEIDKQVFEPNKVFHLKTHVFDKNLDTIGDLLKEALK